MTDALIDVIVKSEWPTRVIDELGSPENLFSHMVRVRDAYRDTLETGILSFPGCFLPDDDHLATELQRSREQLAEKLAGASRKSVTFGVNRLSANEICATAIQHKGIHQGQWYVALKQHGMPLSVSWRQDWSLT